ncbi:polyribonucleotide nucleotidyltransferase [Cytobacillus horneckiae]|uniref:YopX family protein n=1 Tax=Cytobacillus horneckiae TaxID=549687 RepID=UPI0019CFAB81|nr:hypothetical protein [Cytobacillus horneckiae]
MRERKIRGYAVEEMVGSQWVQGFGVYAVEYAEHYAKEIGRQRDWYLYTEGAGIVRVHEDSIGDYIGKKDKNGKEIYEGDIVKTLKGETGEIIFAQGKYQRKINKQWSEDLTYQVEVIGDIYENPELLEGK